ncbi:unnamed protein product [Rotaria magnacalcarata]
MSLTTVNKLINDIEMDHCASSNDSLATTGIGPCIGFVILLNDCHHVFIEHRSSVYLPSTFDLNNVRSVLKSVVQHVSKTLPGSSITGALIFGGVNDQSHFKNLQKLINEILYTAVRSDDENESIHYKQLLKNILCNNVCFNLSSEIPKITGESNIDLIVGKDFENGNSVIIVVQHVIKFAISDVILGVLIIQIKSNSRYFMIDVSQIENNQTKGKSFFTLS